MRWLDTQFIHSSRRNFLHSLAQLPYGGDVLDLALDENAPAAVGLAGRQYITIHNGFDTEFPVSTRRATKCYPHFSAVARAVRSAFPDIVIVQVGTHTSEPLADANINLIGKTSLRQLTGIIKHASMHLDNESGLVHVARCFDVRCCVVFGPTPSDYFGYPDNTNVEPPVCGGCWWVKRDWMDRCPREFEAAPCMFQHDPATIAELVIEAIAQQRLELLAAE